MLEEVRIGAFAVWVVGQITYWIEAYLRSGKARGLYLPSDAMPQAWPARPDHFRKPDGMYYAPGRIVGDRPPQGVLTVAPDLAIEVVSPWDTATVVETKVAEYLEADVRLVWVFYPDSSTVHVYRGGSAAAAFAPPMCSMAKTSCPASACLPLRSSTRAFNVVVQ